MIAKVNYFCDSNSTHIFKYYSTFVTRKKNQITAECDQKSVREAVFNLHSIKTRYFSRNLSITCSIQVPCFDKLKTVHNTVQNEWTLVWNGMYRQLVGMHSPRMVALLPHDALIPNHSHQEK